MPAPLSRAPGFLSASLLLILTGCAATGAPEPVPAAAVTTEGGITAPADLAVADARTCAALAVYELATADDWGLRTTLAQAALNGFAAGGGVPDCAAGVAVALTNDFAPRRWQSALDAVDAVRAGDYTVSPDACARANAVIPAAPAGSPLAEQFPAAARAQCVIQGLAFVEVRP